MVPEILYLDDHLVACHKPSGLLVHRSNLDRHETRFAVQLVRDQLGRRVFPLHRLDRGTSGLLLFALDAASARHIGRQFEERSIGKRYLAIVRGWPADSGLIDHPLTRQQDSAVPRGQRDDDRTTQRTATSPPAAHLALPAQTAFRRLATTELPIAVDRYPTTRYALLELTPLSGRQHQIRRHLKHIAHPIIGDATFGKGIHNRFFQQHFDCARLLLACTQLTLNHPADGRRLVLNAPLAADFSRVAAALGWPETLLATPEP
ncbi:MAG: pseudouridine synthase [Burkholderiaceae bacterium]|nr:pseudouridine synthase [Burkholderiaceae bacterium]